MLRIKKFAAVLPVLMAVAFSGIANAQTIDELTDAARAKKLADLQKATVPVGSVGSQKSEEESQPTILLAIYGVSTNLISEISDSGTSAKYRKGDTLPSGWTVAEINKRTVELKKGKSRKSISFWSIVEASPEAAPRNINSPIMPLPMGR